MKQLQQRGRLPVNTEFAKRYASCVSLSEIVCNVSQQILEMKGVT